MNRYKTALVLFLYLLFAFRASGQIYNFTNYSLDQGLPQATIFSIYQDPRGYLWMGTESGVVRFDGFQFKTYNRTSGLPGNFVRSVVEGPDGNIWVGTDMGIGIFNGISWRSITVKDGLKGTAITKLVPDKNGRVWVATNDSGLNIITVKNEKYYFDYVNKKNGLTADFVLDILHDSDGNSWIAMLGGLNLVTETNGKFVVHNMEQEVSIPSNLFSCLDQDDAGNIWVGTFDAGAYELIRKDKRYETVFYDNKKGISDPRIWDIFCESAGTVWFGTNDNGLYYLNNGVVQNIGTQNGLPGNLILNIYKDRDKNIWIGSMNGLSLFQGFHLIHYTVADGLPGKQILAIKPDLNNSIWVGGDGKGLAKLSFVNNKMYSHFYSSSSGYENEQVSSLDIDAKGNLIVGTRGKGLALMKNGKFRYLTESDGLADDNINCVYWNSLGSIYVGTDVGYNEIKSDKIYTINEENGLIHPEVQTVTSDLKGNIWMGTMGGLAMFHPLNNTYRDFNEVEGLSDLRIHALAVSPQNGLYIGTSNGMYYYKEKADTIVPFLDSVFSSKTINSLLFYDDTTLIVGTTLGFYRVCFNNPLGNHSKIYYYDKTNGFKFSETNLDAICKDSKNQVWFGTVNGITRYTPELEDTLTELPLVYITGIRLFFDPVDWVSKGFNVYKWFNIPNNLSLKYNQNHLTFDFDGIYLKNPERIRYRYKLDPYDKKWSPSISSKNVTYSRLTNGKYSFFVSASVDGVNWSDSAKFDFIIYPPFWKTLWFYIICGLALIVLLVTFIRYRERKLRREKEYLEQVVKERTAEVVAQKEHIEEQNEEITASITYARRIQQAILPNFEILSENTSDCFILYKPRDIVSGDFYWIGKSNNSLIVAAADCTGHGVPGAFMSMLGISFMNKIVKELKVELPEEILGLMRNNVITSLKQGNYEGTTKDGMDMALCVVNLDTLELSFAGAYNPAVIITNNEAVELKADRMPVGLHIKMEDFKQETYQLKKGDCVYMFSDGFQDQMGGPDGRKFMRKNLRELLVSVHQKPFAEQREILESTIESWRNEGLPNHGFEQVDDILILGFTI